MDRADRRIKILVVDDERGPRESLRILLKPAYDVRTAANGAEALEVLRTEAVDLVTIDLNMPGLKGDELMRTVRREFPHVEVVIITGRGSVRSASEAVRLGVADYLQKPFDVVQVNAAVARALAYRRSRGRLAEFLDALGDATGREREVATILRDLALDPSLQGQLQGVIDRFAGTRLEPDSGLPALRMLEVLAETIEAKDLFMIGHARRTAYYAGLLADRLCLSAEQRRFARLGAFVHDVGKVGVPELLLAKAGPLDGEERDVMRAHPELGARLIEPLGIAPEVTAAVRHHHERWDGRGYPDGLREDETPLLARIVQTADVFDAMTSDRPYRPARRREEALDEMRRSAGSQLDAELVKEFTVLMESQAWDIDLDVLAEVVATTESTAPGAPVPTGPSLPVGGERT